MLDKLLLFITALAGVLVALIGLIDYVTPGASADAVIQLVESLPHKEAFIAVADRLAQGRAVIYTPRGAE